MHRSFSHIRIPSVYACGYPRSYSNGADACSHILGFAPTRNKESRGYPRLLPTAVHLDNLLDSLSRVSKHILIIEIENPEITKGLPKFLNKYLYRKFLHDVGERYLSMDEFKTIIFSRFTNVSFSNFKTAVGNYMIADINNDIVLNL